MNLKSIDSRVTSTATHVKTLILGAGLGGLGTGAQLVRSGDTDFVIIEKGPGIGGVWRYNNYPGAACDTESHLYCYSFFPHQTASEKYASRKELLGYMERLATAYDLHPRIRLNCELLKAVWDRHSKLWRFEVRGGGCITARFFVPAWGQLSRPSTPSYPGRERYRGQMFHSAEWDKTVELSGKRVASIGNAASAVQYVPAIAPHVKQLTVFQRSANWIMPRDQTTFTRQELTSFSAEPAQFDRSRMHLHQLREDSYPHRKKLRKSLCSPPRENSIHSSRLALGNSPRMRCKFLRRDDSTRLFRE